MANLQEVIACLNKPAPQAVSVSTNTAQAQQPVTPSPHNYHVMDATPTCPADKAFIAEFHDLQAAREYALDASMFHGGTFKIVKGEYVR